MHMSLYKKKILYKHTIIENNVGNAEKFPKSVRKIMIALSTKSSPDFRHKTVYSITES